jgi:glycosyltransferase involved in cell wall biosynthesis
MCTTDVVVLASISSRTSIEQYGRVIPEAMACGALAIVSDSGTPKELVGESGLVFTEGDVAELASMLIDVVRDPLRYEDRRRSGTERAISKFSINTQAEIYLRAMTKSTDAAKEQRQPALLDI